MTLIGAIFMLICDSKQRNVWYYIET